jgi:hypothetical protein
MSGSLPGGLGVLLASLGLSACSLYLPTVHVAVSLPPLPAHWQETFPEVVFQLEFPASDGTTTLAVDLASIPARPARSAAGPQQTELRLPKGTYLPVVARPCLAETGIMLPCAGGVYPLDMDPGETLCLSWRRGPAAQLLLDLDGHGLDLEHLNVPRLCAEMDLRGGEDPWNLDLPEIAGSLAAGQMRVTAIHLQPLLDLRLPAGRGSWFLESPLRLPCLADATGVVNLQGVTPGLHRLFEVARGSRLDLYVSDQEVLWIPKARAEEAAECQQGTSANVKGRSGGKR